VSVGLSNQKEVPTVDKFTINVAATRLGAACQGAHSPWANVAAAGANHALGWELVRAAAGASGARHRAAVRPVQPVNAQLTQLPQFAAELPPMTAMVTRKPENVHQTRISASGYGALGPHPERERLA
jgi:hypothetical protein